MVRTTMLLAALTAGCSSMRPAAAPRAAVTAVPSDSAERSTARDIRPRPASALFIPGARTTEEAPARLAFEPRDTREADLLHASASDEPGPPATLGAPAPRDAGKLDDPAPPPRAVEISLRQLHDRAMKRYAAMDTYIMRLRRREVIHGAARPEEIMLCKIRKEPFSVYFKWLGSEGKGREVTYSAGKHGDLIHSLTATGDVLFLPGGKRFKVAPDSVLVRSKTRYPITEAGLGPLLARFGRLVDALEKGDPREGSARVLGEVKRPEFDDPVIAVEQTLHLKTDPNLPKGGVRRWFFDKDLGLPVLIITQDEAGREVEYYCHDRFMIPANLRDDDFDPDLLWKTAP